MPPTVLEAHQWQLCDACGRKPLELVEIALCLLHWYSCIPTRLPRRGDSQGWHPRRNAECAKGGFSTT